MNRKQRMLNRLTADLLSDRNVTCPECGERGKHYVVVPLFAGFDSPGFWTCPRLYGADGRRIEA